MIRREIRLVEGDAYNPLLVDRAKKRLEKLGLLQEGCPCGGEPGSTRDRVIVDFAVEEQSTGELGFRRRLFDHLKA